MHQNPFTPLCFSFHSLHFHFSLWNGGPFIRALILKRFFFFCKWSDSVVYTKNELFQSEGSEGPCFFNVFFFSWAEIFEQKLNTLWISKWCGTNPPCYYSKTFQMILDGNSVTPTGLVYFRLMWQFQITLLL